MGALSLLSSLPDSPATLRASARLIPSPPPLQILLPTGPFSVPLAAGPDTGLALKKMYPDSGRSDTKTFCISASTMAEAWCSFRW